MEITQKRNIEITQKWNIEITQMGNTCTSTNGNVACVVPFEVVTARSSIQIDLQMQIFQPKNQIF